MITRRRFLVASSFARIIQREHGGRRQVEGYFPPQQDRISWVRLEESRATLILRTAGVNGGKEEQTDIPIAHAHALLDVCAGEIDYVRTNFPLNGRMIFLDQFFRPGGLNLLTVTFEKAGEADSFRPPLWFGPEVTTDSRYSQMGIALNGVGENLDIPPSDVGLHHLLDILESRTASQNPHSAKSQAEPLQDSRQSTKASIEELQKAMKREMERTLLNMRSS